MAEWSCNKCRHNEEFNFCVECRRGSKYEEKSISWGDKIRAMSDEELAEFLEEVETCGYNDCSIARDKNGCWLGMLDWLKSEVKE